MRGFLLLLWLAQCIWAQSNAELEKLFNEDQKDRAGWQNFTAAQGEAMAKRDRERRRAVMEIVRGGSLKTGEDYDRAAFLFQHGETPADYLLAHILAVAAVSLGHNSTWISAATLDRYLNSAGKTQVFGTQLGADVAVDGELITESLRQLYCVPSLKDREKINQALAKKLPLPRITPCVPKADAFQSKWEMLRKMPDGSVRKGVLNLGAMTLIEEGKKTDLKSFTAGDRQLTIATASEEFRFQVRGDVMEGTFRVNTGATGAVVALR